MSDPVSLAREAGARAVDHVLPAEAAEYVGAEFLSNKAIDAFLTVLSSEGYKIVGREADDGMWEAGNDLMPSEDDVRDGIDETDIFYEVIPGPGKIWTAMWEAAPALTADRSRLPTREER